MLSIEEALALVEKVARPLAPRRMPLGEVAGLVLAEDVVSEVDSPPYNKSTMDGYAVRSADRQPERQLLEEIAAGSVPRYAVTPGTAVRIMTGAPLPEGADAVVPIEQTEAIDDTTIRLHQIEPIPGQNIMPLAASVRAGDVVLRSGSLIRPIEVAILAEIGRGMIQVHPRPRVAVLPTGNEIVPVGEKAGLGQIRNSNGPMLFAAATRAGAEAIELGIARDQREELARWIEQGLSADVLVLSGGVSAGAYDLVPHVLQELGVEQVFHKIALRPGKPLWFGVKEFRNRQALVFGLPGNPVSTFVCFELFVQSAISALAGRGFATLELCSAVLSHDYHHKGGRACYLPARLVATDQSPENLRGAPLPAVELLPWQGSGDLATLARANAMVRLGSEAATLAPGAIVDVMPL